MKSTRTTINNKLQNIADQLRGEDPASKRAEIRRCTSDVDPDKLTSYLDDITGESLDESDEHAGVGTTIYYEQNGAFHPSHLSNIPWAGYAATLSGAALYRQGIDATNAFHEALFRGDTSTGYNSKWTGTDQATNATVEQGALTGALIDGERNFTEATFNPGSAPRSTWHGRHNGYKANIPGVSFLKSIDNKEDTNFQETMYVG